MHVHDTFQTTQRVEFQTSRDETLRKFNQKLSTQNLPSKLLHNFSKSSCGESGVGSLHRFAVKHVIFHDMKLMLWFRHELYLNWIDFSKQSARGKDSLKKRGRFV
jgi:hypothetical protein